MTEPEDPSAVRRLLLVHAHPDDESIGNGATMARYAAEGAGVTLVTCTLGEEGEVIGTAQAHLTADREDALGPYRATELAAAMRELGVVDHRLLGGPGRFRDSGMMGVDSNKHPEAFWQADVDEAAALLAAVIREVRPQVLVTYDPNGGYGHPDHIQAHRVAMRGYELAADPTFRQDLGPAHEIAKVYWNCVPRSALQAPEDAANPFPAEADEDDIPGLVDDAEVTAVVDGSAYAERKAAAMRAHATQITVAEPWFALSNDRGQLLSAVECYRLARGRSAVAAGTVETDLFAGVATR